MGKPSPPTPPNPVQVSAAQTQSNLQTAQEQAVLNNVNQVTPYGNVNYTHAGPYGQWTQTTQLSPAEQQLFNQQMAAQQGALGIGNTQLGRISNTLGQNLNTPN